MGVLTLKEAGERLAPLMASRPEVLAAYIFGSVAADRTRPGSDIDVAVLLDASSFNELPVMYRADFIADAGAALGSFDVDVVLLNEAPPALSYNVLTKGRLIYEHSRSARIKFQVKTLNVFLDLEPIHRVHLEYLKRRYLTRQRHG